MNICDAQWRLTLQCITKKGEHVNSGGEAHAPNIPSQGEGKTRVDARPGSKSLTHNYLF